MVSKIMVQDPGIGGYACMESVNGFKAAIQEVRFKSKVMLVMMIPCTDANLGNDHQYHPGKNEPDILYEEVNREIASEQKKNDGNRQSVCRVSKYSHNRLLTYLNYFLRQYF